MSRWLALGAGIVLVSALPRTLHAPTSATPRIAIVAPAEPGTWLLGARLAMDEATRTAELLRRDLHFVEHFVEVAAEPDAAAVVAHEAAAGTVLLIAALDGPAWSALEQGVKRRDLVLIDARVSHPDPVACSPGVFRVGLPDDPATPAPPHELWHESLDRYGAIDLNERFRRRFGQGMDGAAWAAWLSVKIAAEALLRVERAETNAVAAYLRSGAATFDGHKGRPLRFEAASQHLVQPVYTIDGSGRAEEVDWPVRPACAAGGADGGP